MVTVHSSGLAHNLCQHSYTLHALYTRSNHLRGERNVDTARLRTNKQRRFDCYTLSHYVLFSVCVGSNRQTCTLYLSNLLTKVTPTQARVQGNRAQTTTKQHTRAVNPVPLTHSLTRSLCISPLYLICEGSTLDRNNRRWSYPLRVIVFSCPDKSWRRVEN